MNQKVKNLLRRQNQFTKYGYPVLIQAAGGGNVGRKII